MRANTPFLAACLLSLGLSACGVEDTVCDAAERHIEHCLGMVSDGSGSCEGADAALAAELLTLDCSGLRSLLANAGAAGKADADCLAPWDCPEAYPAVDEACGLYDMAKCQSHCDALYADDHIRLRRVTCELLEGGIAHCQCEGYWLPWPEKKSEPGTPPPEEPDDPAPDEP